MSTATQKASVLGAALQNETRARILQLVTAGVEPSLTGLARKLGTSLGNTSHHVSILQKAGLVVTQMFGQEKRLCVAAEWELVLEELFGHLEELVGEGEEESEGDGEEGESDE